MGRKANASGIIICLLLSVLSFTLSSNINSLFDIEVDSNVAIETPLVGLVDNESWLVVLVDFDSDPLENNQKQEFANLLEEQAQLYFTEATGRTINIEIDVHDEIIRSQRPLQYYGTDGESGRDYGDGAEFMPAKLSEYVVDNLNVEDWSKYDLNEDKIVDRFLIVHSTLSQEQGGGSTSRIWSHFTTFQTPISIDEYVIEHYTMSSLRHGMNGIGTILHEMMHQFGAFDLYPVHDSGYSGSWKGIGIWDIMASGNWNGGGDKPSLPTGPTMETIGHNATVNLNLEWPSTTQSPCIGPAFDIQSRSDGGARVKIQIGPEEFVWFEKRSKDGFDEALPGEGILVLLEDRTAGDAQYNAMNIDQKRPYLRVIEADGNDEQLQGINDGVFEDLFQPGDTFGELGIEIRNHDGVLVPWHANVTSVDNVWRIEIHSLHCSPSFSLDLPDYGLTMLQGEGFTIQITESQTPVSCIGMLTGSDGRTINFSVDTSMQDNQIAGVFSDQGIVDSIATFSGIILCDEFPINIRTTVTTVGTQPLVNKMHTEEKIDPIESSTITIPYIGDGLGSGAFSVDLRGPITRIGTINSPLTITNGTGSIIIEINPNGLLQPNMYVFGEVLLTSFNGETWTIDIELQAESESRIPILDNQSAIIGTFFAVCSVWFTVTFLAEIRSKNEKNETILEQETTFEFD